MFVSDVSDFWFVGKVEPYFLSAGEEVLYNWVCEVCVSMTMSVKNGHFPPHPGVGWTHYKTLFFVWIASKHGTKVSQIASQFASHPQKNDCYGKSEIIGRSHFLKVIGNHFSKTGIFSPFFFALNVLFSKAADALSILKVECR